MLIPRPHHTPGFKQQEFPRLPLQRQVVTACTSARKKPSSYLTKPGSVFFPDGTTLFSTFFLIVKINTNHLEAATILVVFVDIFAFQCAFLIILCLEKCCQCTAGSLLVNPCWHADRVLYNAITIKWCASFRWLCIAVATGGTQ